MKRYFDANEDDGMCYTLEFLIEYAKLQGVKILKLIPAKRIKAFFACEIHGADINRNICKKCNDYEKLKGNTKACVREFYYYKPMKKMIIVKII